ncbi:MAG: hypothetical protein H6843_00015, partial [Rhodospirillaceae bacterium]|nr:hypothetical protein [Rhodospirillaceae bacterium]
MALSPRTLGWIGQPSTRQQLVAFVRLVAHRFVSDRGLQTASALTYTTLLSLIPL